ncbi:unnamed protein product [Heterobilharzia americana]|nr:unnamed protein product [Heterobilharzia americana]
MDLVMNGIQLHKPLSSDGEASVSDCTTEWEIYEVNLPDSVEKLQKQTILRLQLCMDESQTEFAENHRR